MRLFLMFYLSLLTNLAIADSWYFDPVEKDRVESFGDTRVVLTTDARKDSKYPDFIVSIYSKGELRSKYRGVAFQKLFAAPDNSLFIGLSNRGLPGTAVVVFDKEGRLLLEVKHGMASFDYCRESVTLERQWFDAENPDVKFVAEDKYGGYSKITLRDCRGNVVDVAATVLQAYARSIQKGAERKPD